MGFSTRFGQAAKPEQASRDSFLLQLSDTLSLLEDPAVIHEAAARSLGEHLCADRAYYAEIVGEDNVVIHQDFARGLPSIAGSHSAEFLGSKEVPGLRRGDTVIIHRAATGDTASGMLVGLVKSGRWAAAFGVHSASPREWSSLEIDQLQQTAERTWSAVQRVKTLSAEREALLREGRHRLKNTLQLTASLLNLQANQADDPQMRTHFDEARSRVHSIATVYESIHCSRDRSTFDMAAYAKAVVAELLRSYELQERLRVVIDGRPPGLDLDRAAPFGLLLNELALHVCKHASAAREGEVSVRFSCENGAHTVTVAAVGVAVPPRLDAFPSKLVHMLAQQLGCDVLLPPGNGFEVQVRFPVAESHEE